MLTELNKYLQETPREILVKEWESVSDFSNTGPLVSEMLDDWQWHYGEDYSMYFDNQEPERVKINKHETPYFAESFFCL